MHSTAHIRMPSNSKFDRPLPAGLIETSHRGSRQVGWRVSKARVASIGRNRRQHQSMETVEPADRIPVVQVDYTCTMYQQRTKGITIMKFAHEW